MFRRSESHKAWRLISGLLVVSCSKVCGHQDVAVSPDAIAPEPVIADAATADAAIITDASLDSARATRLEMPDACLDIATDFEWRERLYCDETKNCDDDTLDAGQVTAWDEQKKDLNGDGIDEVVRGFGIQNRDGSEEVHVYLGGAQPCAVHLQSFDGTFSVLPIKHEGWSDLTFVDGESFCEGAFGCGCKASETFYIHTINGYVEDKTRRVEGKVGHCPQIDDPCTKSSDCAPTGMVCVDGKCAPAQ
jgi:hypothetical protein